MEKSFSVWLNNEYLPTHLEYSWIKEVSSKATKHAVECGYSIYKILNIRVDSLNSKKKDISDVKMYFVKNNPKDCCERRINIPTLGWVRQRKRISANDERWLADSAGRFEKSGSILCIRFSGCSRIMSQIEGRSNRRNRN